MDLLSYLTRSPSSILETVFLVCLLYIAVLKSDRIISVGRFRLACLLFAVELVVPAVSSIYSSYAMSGGSAANSAWLIQPPLGSNAWLVLTASVLLALSFFLVIGSVLPARRTAE